MEILKVHDLCKTYGKGEAEVEALKKVSFSLDKGEFAAIVGESGSGKSTLLNCIGALDAPSSGKILVDGQDLFSMKEEQRTIFRRRNIGFIFQSFQLVSKAASESNHVGIISVGWDPGMFSLNRMYANAILTNGKDYTFWGKGVSQGHSDAIRRIDGVKDGKQYTIPVEAALEAVRSGQNPELTTRQKHTRECFVVAEEGADLARIEQEIKTMPNYFDEYDTTVHFISEEELKRDHSGIPHGGFVIRTGKTGWNDENSHVIEYSLKLDSNPEFTSSVIVAYARAAYRMNQEGQKGCKTVFDVAPAYLSALDGAELRKHLL